VRVVRHGARTFAYLCQRVTNPGIEAWIPPPFALFVGEYDLTDTSDPSRVMMRRIAGAFAEYEKARLVAKLKAARDRKRKAAGKCEGRKSWAEINPILVQAAMRSSPSSCSTVSARGSSVPCSSSSSPM
jgi:hypothetical protein